jgi:hypothetical protein
MSDDRPAIEVRDYEAEAQEYADNYNPEGERRGGGPYGDLCADCRATECPANCFEPTHERNVLIAVAALLGDWAWAAWRGIRSALCDPSGEQR